MCYYGSKDKETSDSLIRVFSHVSTNTQFWYIIFHKTELLK